MSHNSAMLVLDFSGDSLSPSAQRLADSCESVSVHSLTQALNVLTTREFSGVILLTEKLASSGFPLIAPSVFDRLPDGYAITDLDLKVLWANSQFGRLGNHSVIPSGVRFMDLFADGKFADGSHDPFQKALAEDTTVRSILKRGEKTYLQTQVTPILEPGEERPTLLFASVRDISAEMQQQEIINAIYRAGQELRDISPQEILEMTVEDRVDLLKSKILHHTEHLLHYKTAEIRLIDPATRRLTPLLAAGMDAEACSRELFADPQNNGVTGFVAFHKQSYLCEDTSSDPLYLPGAPGARSSLTVPLMLHNELLGTFNVESPNVGAFTDQDLQFLELFGREVAFAIHTLELLAVEKVSTTEQSTVKILNKVASPVDEILNDLAWIQGKFMGLDPALMERLLRIQTNTREIRQEIQESGIVSLPETMRPGIPERPQRPLLRGKLILIVDSEESVRKQGHELLGRYGCLVETAHDGQEALLMSQSCQYDAVIADIRLPDMDGYEIFSRLREINPNLPVILLTGFGWDSKHSIVKARQQGLLSVLYKPFRLDQLIRELEKTISPRNAGTAPTRSLEKSAQPSRILGNLLPG